MVLFRDIKINSCYIQRRDYPYCVDYCDIEDIIESNNPIDGMFWLSENNKTPFLILEKKFLFPTETVSKQAYECVKVLFFGSDAVGWLVNLPYNGEGFWIVPHEL